MNPQLLARVPIFQDLPNSELERLAEHLQQIEVPPDTVIFREGESGDHFYIVLYGQLDIIKALGTPDERLIASRGPGEFIGELGLVNPDGLRTASVRTRGATHLWRMTHSDFDDLVRRQPGLAFEMVKTLGNRLTYAHNMTIQDLHHKNEQLQKAYDDLKDAHAQIVEKERMERELQVAFEIQMSILPQSLPEIPRYNFGARIEPAHAVGGDFFDVFSVTPDSIGIVVGDVADKGVPSAIFMAQTHALIYAEATQCGSPVEVLTRVNHHLMRMNASSLFVTVIYGELNRKTGLFTYARAGHELPILGLRTENARLLPWNQGQPLGLLDDPVFDEQSIQLEPDSLLVMYTDGLTDCRSPDGEFFGMDRLKNKLDNWHGQTAQEFSNELWQELRDFQQDAAQDDDVTLVTVQTEPKG